jgi:hypothetical protein
LYRQERFAAIHILNTRAEKYISAKNTHKFTGRIKKWTITDKRQPKQTITPRWR